MPCTSQTASEVPACPLWRKPEVFNEKEEGTSPWFVLEVTSKKTVRYDRTSKPAIYRKAKVPEIFLLDRMKSPWELSGKRRDPKTGRYLKVRPDERGRLLAETLGVYFSVSASGDDLILEDAETGEVLRKPVAESQARRAAERQAAAEGGRGTAQGGGGLRSGKPQQRPEGGPG